VAVVGLDTGPGGGFAEELHLSVLRFVKRNYYALAVAVVAKSAVSVEA
jgi:hypothetical protein